MGAYITYDGTTLNLTLADLTTLASWSRAFLINIPATVGGDTAYVGFTGATAAGPRRNKSSLGTIKPGNRFTTPACIRGAAWPPTAALRRTETTLN